MEHLLNHIKKTCPHAKTPSRQALRNNRFDLWDWELEPRIIPITEALKANCKPCSKKDVARYQKLIASGSMPPAIVVTEESKIMDGAHRLQALINNGEVEVLAYLGKLKST